MSITLLFSYGLQEVWQNQRLRHDWGSISRVMLQVPSATWYHQTEKINGKQRITTPHYSSKSEVLNLVGLVAQKVWESLAAQLKKSSLRHTGWETLPLNIIIHQIIKNTVKSELTTTSKQQQPVHNDTNLRFHSKLLF